MGYSYYKNAGNVEIEDIKDIKDKWTVWTEEGINNQIIYIYDNDDVSEAKDWKCATVICAPGLQVNYQWSGWNIFALNNILDKINNSRLLLNSINSVKSTDKKEEKSEVTKDNNEKSDTKTPETKTPETKTPETKTPETNTIIEEEKENICDWNYGSKIEKRYQQEDENFEIALNKIMESVSLAIKLDCGGREIKAIKDILNNITLELKNSKTKTNNKGHICLNEKDENGNDIFFISEHLLKSSNRVMRNYCCNYSINSIVIDFNLRILSPKNKAAKKHCAKLLDKYIRRDIIYIVKEADSIPGFK